MDLKSYGAALSLLNSVFDRRSSTDPVLAPAPQKPRWKPGPIQQPFPRKTPEETGIASGYIADFLRELKADPGLDMHNILVLHKGAVIAEGSFGAYDHAVWHITHSECKSITSLAIGMLLQEGRIRLDDRITDIFKDRGSKLSQLTHKNITIRQLLNMTSGVLYSETGSVTDRDWVKGFLDSMTRHEPGKQFSYNSMNTYMLAAIVHQLTGLSLTEYLRPRLWEPLGISDFFWETCPMGIEKAGWGLYIRPEDMAKIGQLVMQKGCWNGRQLVFENYIKAATTAQAFPTEDSCRFDYGYQIWVGRESSCFLFNGMFGQNVMGFPDTELLLVSNAGNTELFQQSRYYDITDKYFGQGFHPEARLSPNPEGNAALDAVLREMRGSAPAAGSFFSRRRSRKLLHAQDAVLAGLDGLHWKPAQQEETGGIGLLPLLVQATQNNYTKGLQAVSFRMDRQLGLCLMEVAEGECVYSLPLDLQAPALVQLDFGGEVYRTAVTCRLTTDEDDTPVLRIRLSFQEIANARILKLFFLPDGKLRLEMSEIPGKGFVLELARTMTTGIRQFPVLDSLYSKADKAYPLYRITTAMEPQVLLEPAEPQE